jgi:hypothetical protein
MNIKISDSAINRSIVQQSVQENTVTDSPAAKPVSQFGVASSLDRFQEASMESYINSALKLSSGDNQNDISAMKDRLEELNHSQSDGKMFLSKSGVDSSKFDHYVAMNQTPNPPAAPGPVDEAFVNQRTEQTPFERMRVVFGNIMRALSSVGERITSSIK